VNRDDIMIDEKILLPEEVIMYRLRSIFEQYGYTRYKMSKFEEYDFYAKNKAFLVSDEVISFTDMDGKLMALKPDVTLSIIKNQRDNLKDIKKLYYNENIYRVEKGSNAFKEIMQTGLECLGNLDAYSISEVIVLAAKSLRSLSSKTVIYLSHLGILSEFVEKINSLGNRLLTPEESKRIFKCLEEKNGHEIVEICKKLEIPEKQYKVFRELVMLNDTPKKALRFLAETKYSEEILSQLENIVSAFEELGFEDILRIDMSVINDMSYYNGLVFSGFIEGVPDSVLRGGQYDKLSQELKGFSAIGFAVYLNKILYNMKNINTYDIDTLVLYDEKSDIRELTKITKELIEKNIKFKMQNTLPEKKTYRRLVDMTNFGV